MAAETALAVLDERGRPDVEVFADGSARDGRFDGVGAAVVAWRDGSPGRTVTAAAGALASSTAAETVAARVGLEAVVEDLAGRGKTGCLVRLLTDSRALWHRLQAGGAPGGDAASNEAVAALWRLARGHRVQVVWVPGHAGVAGNEAADRAAAAGTEEPQGGVPVSVASLRALLREWVRARWEERYREVCGSSAHDRLSGGGQRLCTAGLSRAEETVLFRLRLNRLDGLQATRAAWGRAESGVCPHCGDGPEDAAHFLLQCPRWTAQRLQFLGPVPAEDCIQREPAAAAKFIRHCGLLQ